MNNKQNLRDEFPKQFELCGRLYTVEYVSETAYSLIVAIVRDNRVVTRYRIRKEDGYINIKRMEWAICRMFEGDKYWKEVLRDNIPEDDRSATYEKYWRKSLMIDREVLGYEWNE